MKVGLPSCDMLPISEGIGPEILFCWTSSDAVCNNMSRDNQAVSESPLNKVKGETNKNVLKLERPPSSGGSLPDSSLNLIWSPSVYAVVHLMPE